MNNLEQKWSCEWSLDAIGNGISEDYQLTNWDSSDKLGHDRGKNVDDLLCWPWNLSNGSSHCKGYHYEDEKRKWEGGKGGISRYLTWWVERRGRKRKKHTKALSRLNWRIFIVMHQAWVEENIQRKCENHVDWLKGSIGLNAVILYAVFGRMAFSMGTNVHRPGGQIVLADEELTWANCISSN